MNTERRTALEAMYLETYPVLRDAAYIDPDILFSDADRIAAAVAEKLDSYSGSDDDVDEFTHWALNTIVVPHAERLRWFCQTRREYRKTVRGAIAGVLKGCADLGAELGYEKGLSVLDELEAQVWTLVYLDLEAWMQKGTASLSTRLQAKAKPQARAWKSSRRVAKRRYAGEPVEAEARVFREADDRSMGKLPSRPITLGPNDVPHEEKSPRVRSSPASKPKPEAPTPGKKFCARCNAALRTWSESDLCYPCIESNGLPTLRDARREARKRKKAAENKSTK